MLDRPPDLALCNLSFCLVYQQRIVRKDKYSIYEYKEEYGTKNKQISLSLAIDHLFSNDNSSFKCCTFTLSTFNLLTSFHFLFKLCIVWKMRRATLSRKIKKKEKKLTYNTRNIWFASAAYNSYCRSFVAFCHYFF